MVGCDVKFKECGLVDNRNLLLVLWLNWRSNPLSTSIDVVTRKNINSIKEMSAVDVVFSPGTPCGLRRRFISFVLYAHNGLHQRALHLWLLSAI